MNYTKLSITKNKLIKLIEPSFEKDLIQNSYEIKTKKAINFLTHTRFDIAFKLLHLEMKDRGVGFAKEIYKDHIRAFSLGKFIEPENKNKNSIKDFLEEFDKIFNSIKSIGFDSDKTLIPISKNGSIADGAHRLTSAIYLDKDVDCVKLDIDNYLYDYQFFYNRNVSSELLDVAATKFVEYAKNIHIALIWPTAQGHEKDIKKTIPNIVYKKEIELTPNGAHNLLSQVYYGEDWIGGVENNFRGAKGKLVECFKTFDPVRVFAFQADSLNEVLDIKEQVRNIFNINKHSIHITDKHSIHITDTKEEAVRVARVVFNNNSIHFLNHAEPNKYISTHKKIAEIKGFLVKNKIDASELVLDSGMVLSAYGLREASDIDYLLNDRNQAEYVGEEMDSHDNELGYHGISKAEMIFNPKYYFYFDDIKFVSFPQLYQMKKNRGDVKDINDCKMMESLIENNWLKGFISKTKQILYYAIMRYSIKVLKAIGAYEIVRDIYKKIKAV